MKISTFIIALALLWICLNGCSKPAKVIPEPPEPETEKPEEPRDTLVVEIPKVDTTLYDTSWVHVAKGFEELLILRGVIDDKINDGKVKYGTIKDIDSINIGTTGFSYYRFTSIRGVEYFKKLRYLNVTGSYLDSLDLRKNPKVEIVLCHGVSATGIGDNRTIKYINLTGCPELRRLNCEINLISKLDITKNSKLAYLNCFGNMLKELDISQNTNLDYLNTSGNHEIAHLALEKVPQLTKLYCEYNSLPFIQTELLPNLVELNCSYNSSTSSFSKISLTKNPKLELLYINGTKMTSIDLTQNPKLKFLSVTSNQFMNEIDVRHLSDLRLFYIMNSNFTRIDISGSPELDCLNIDGSKLSEIDVSKNHKLTKFYCFYQDLITSLNLSMCKNLSTCITIGSKNLKTICVDKIPPQNNSNWIVDEGTKFITDCR